MKGGKIKNHDNHYTQPYEVLKVLGKGNVNISYKKNMHIYIPEIIRQMYRKPIDNLIEILPYFINMITLRTYLIQTEIFNQDPCNIPTWSRKLNSVHTIKDIFPTVKTRKQDANKSLIISLRLSYHIVTVDIMDIINYPA